MLRICRRVILREVIDWWFKVDILPRNGETTIHDVWIFCVIISCFARWMNGRFVGETSRWSWLYGILKFHQVITQKEFKNMLEFVVHYKYWLGIFVMNYSALFYIFLLWCWEVISMMMNCLHIVGLVKKVHPSPKLQLFNEIWIHVDGLMIPNFTIYIFTSSIV